MISYPITTFPDSLTQEINIKSYLTECTEEAPKKPDKPEKQKVHEGCLTGLGFYVIVAIVVSGVITLGTSLPFGIVVALILWIVYSIIGQTEYKKKLRVYDADYKKYLNDIQIYNETIQQTKRNIEDLQKNGDNSWKIELTKKRLASHTFKLYSEYGKRGASEDYFVKQIQRFYDCRIFQNPPIKCRTVGITYYPDIVLMFEKYNLAIALEIDEPYELKDGMPIHYYNIEDGIPVFSDEEVFSPSLKSLYTSRSKEITNEGFILMRFAEEQVVLQPDACCKYINDKVLLHFGLDISSKDLSNIQEVKRINMWTFDEAKNMYRNRYRENYLKIIRNI